VGILIFLLSLFFFYGSDSFAQVYKYVEKGGVITFTDNPPSSLFNDRVSSNKESKQEITQNKKSGSEIKDIMQLGNEILKEELAKPPERQNHRLIQEMAVILYGDISIQNSQ
jgi:hypothetical protein